MALRTWVTASGETSIGQALGSFREHVWEASWAADPFQAAPRLLDVAPGFSRTASKFIRVSQFDQHRHDDAGRVLVGLEVDDELIGYEAISQCRIMIADEAVRPRRQIPPDRRLTRCLRSNIGSMFCA